MKTEYWVVFPQGIKQKWKSKETKLHGTTYKRMLVAKTEDEAWELMEKYDGAYFETIEDNGETRNAVNWVTWEKFNDNDNITTEELWDMWNGKDKIILPMEKNYGNKK